MTRIEFDTFGRPTWRNVDTAELKAELQNSGIPEWVAGVFSNFMQTPCQFTESDMQWFRKPLERSE